MFAVLALLSSRHISSDISSGWNLLSLFDLLVAILLGSGTIYCFILYIAKVRSER
jgi:hypothetical protein